jgi:hypothetical protein
MQGRQFTSINLSVNDLILHAYGIHLRQLRALTQEASGG